MSLLEAPGAETLPTASLSVPFVCHRGAYSVLLTHDNLFKPTPAKQVVVTAIVILNNICRGWTMYLWMDSVKFLWEALDDSIL